jgi:RND family efflux transporter MFP subunit
LENFDHILPLIRARRFATEELTMYRDWMRLLLQALRPGFALGGPAMASDRDLMDRFAKCGDQAAFELLLWRHGPMVLALCKRLLHRPEDVEDAFQATFLTLVRKRAAITQKEALGSWLYRVAYRVALRARQVNAKRSGREQSGVDQLIAPERVETTDREIQSVLLREIDRLPSRERAAFILCCVQGKTGEEAAEQLGCPAGTVSSRLTRARQRLRVRLARRGLGPAAGAVVLIVAEDVAASSWVTRVISTLQAVQSYSAGREADNALSARAVSLARGVCRTMYFKSLQPFALMFLVTAALATGGLLYQHGLAAAPPGQVESNDPPADPAAKRDPSAKPFRVRVVWPGRGGIERNIEQPGTLVSSNKLELFPLVAGAVKDLKVDIGDSVRIGDVLARIDAPLVELEEKQAAVAVQLAQAQLQDAQSRVATAQAEIKMAESGVVQRQAELESARATVGVRAADVARAKALRTRGEIDAETDDQKRAALDVAKSQETGAAAALASARVLVQIQQTKVEQAKAAVATSRANVEAAEVGLAKARYSTGLTRLVSTVDGVVTQRAIHNGQYVTVRDQASQMPLLTVQQTDQLRLVLEIPGMEVPLVRPGAPVDISFYDLPGVRFPASTVSRIGFVEDPTSRTMRVEIDIPNPKQILRPGMFGGASIHAYKGPATALRLPAAALVRSSDDESAVYVVHDGKAHRTVVRVGAQIGGEVEILSGLKKDHGVVADAKELSGEDVPVEILMNKGGGPTTYTKEK